MVLAAGPRALARLVWDRPGLGSAAVHGLGLAIRLGFMFAVLHFSGAALLGRYGLLAGIEVVSIYLAGFEFHAFTTRRYAKRPGEISLRICLASHRRMLMLSAPLAMLGAAVATRVFVLDLTAIELFAFLVIVGTGSVAQELTRYVVMTRNPMLAIVLQFIRTALWQPVALLFLATAEPLRAIVIAWAIAAVLSVGWGAWILRSGIWSRVRPRRRYLAHGLNVARNFYAMASASVLQSNLERFVLQAFLGPAAVGIFTFFQNLANTLPALIQAAVLNVWMARMLTAFGQRLADRFQALAQLSKVVLLTCLVVSAGLLLGVVGLAALVGRADYIRFIWILPPLLVAQTCQMWSQPLYLAMFGAHRDQAIMWLSLGVLAFSLLLCVVAVMAFGITGAVVSQLAGGATLALSRWIVFRRYLHRDQL